MDIVCCWLGLMKQVLGHVCVHGLLSSPGCFEGLLTFLGVKGRRWEQEEAAGVEQIHLGADECLDWRNQNLSFVH